MKQQTTIDQLKDKFDILS